MREASRAPLTFGQLSTWRSIYNLPPEGAVSANMIRKWRLPAGHSVAQVRAVLDAIQQRHESLRTGFVRIGEEGVEQKVWNVDSAPVEVVAAGDDAYAAAGRIAAEYSAQPFDLENELPWKLAVVATPAGEATHVAFCVNHMAADGSAVDLIHNELIGRLAGNDPAGTPLSCRQLAEQEKAAGWTARRRAATGYWRKTLVEAGVPARESTGQGVVQWSTLKSAPALSAAQVIADRLQASLTTTVLAAYCQTLSERLQSRDLLLGLISANRSLPRSRDMITTLNQLIPLRVRIEPREELPDLIQRLRWETLVAYRHGSYCVDDLADLTAELGYDGVGKGFKYFFNFIPGIPGRLKKDAATPAESWAIDTTTEGRNNGFSSYFRGRDGDHVIECTLRESSLESDGGSARAALTESTRAFLVAFQDALLTAEVAVEKGAAQAATNVK